MIDDIGKLLKFMSDYEGASFGLAVFILVLIGGIGNTFRRK